MVRLSDGRHDFSKMWRQVGMFVLDVSPALLGQVDAPAVGVERRRDQRHRDSIDFGLGSRNPLFRTRP